MTHFVTYGDAGWQHAVSRIALEASRSGAFSAVATFGREDLPRSFLQATSPYIHDQTGGGWWLWKAYVVKRALDSVADGDVVVYADSGCTISKDAAGKIADYASFAAENGVASFSLDAFPEEKWTWEKVFTYFGVPTESEIRETGQRIGTYFAVCKNQKGKEIVDRMYAVAVERPDLFVGSREIPRVEDYHRNDQSVFSVLLKVRGVPAMPRESGRIHPLGFYEDSPIWSTRSRSGSSIQGAA